MSVSVLALKFISFVVGLLPDIDFSSIPVLDVYENLPDLFNIFAWANFFLPTSTILLLLTITGTYYTFRAIYVILRDFIF